jgi:hypothetical protein
MVALSSLAVLSLLVRCLRQTPGGLAQFPRVQSSPPLRLPHIPRECTRIIRFKSGNWGYVEDACKCGEDLGRVGPGLAARLKTTKPTMLAELSQKNGSLTKLAWLGS